MTTEPENSIKIIVTDDHAIFRTGVRTALINRKDIQIIGEAENGLQLLNLLKQLQPDIIIMGISMPVMDGVETLPILKQKYPGIKVIILTMHNDPGTICEMIELGANAYLTKECGSEKIYEAILACHTKWFFINDIVRGAILDSTQDLLKGFHVKEIKLLELLHKGKTSKEIGKEIDLSPRTVMVIIDKLKTKTKCKSVDELIEFAQKKKIID